MKRNLQEAETVGGRGTSAVKGSNFIVSVIPYLEYKSSGQSWFADVPRHWSVVPNRALFSEVKEPNHPEEPLLSVTIMRGIVPQKALLTGSSKKDSSREDKSAYKLVQPRDIAYNKMRAWQGAIGVSDFRGIVSPAYVVQRLRDERNVPRYFHHLYRTPHFAKEAERWSYGITSDMWSLRPEHFRLIYSPVPPPEEQTAIVTFIEWASGRLERAVTAKRKVIALLNEEKEVVIHRAVTKGLDPSASLRPSGVPWLGEIPAHWDVRKIKFVVSTEGGMTPNKGVARFWEGRIPWVTPKDMKVREIADSRDHITDAALRETNISLIQPRAVLIVVRGMILARTFPTAVTDVPVTVNQDLKALTPKAELNPDFLVSLLTGIQRELLTLVEEAGHGTRCLRTDSWENFSIPLPPVPEQMRVNEKLKLELGDLNTAIARLERDIELLREYRTRLVSDVVTGKLDVREAAVGLPDEGVSEITQDDAGDSDDLAAAEDEVAV